MLTCTMQDCHWESTVIAFREVFFGMVSATPTESIVWIKDYKPLADIIDYCL